jgi:hypothetical protein
MFNFFKYFIYTMILFSLLLFYLLFTPLGNKDLYNLISYKVSDKMGLEVIVKTIDISHFPNIVLKMNIEQKAKLILTGYMDDNQMDMDYTIDSDCIASDICKIDDVIDIHGHVKGPFYKLLIQGEGRALDGNVSYSAMKFPDKVEDIRVSMSDVNSTKLLKLLGQDPLIQGKANAEVHFEQMATNTKKGSITYDVTDNNFSGIPMYVQSKVMIDDMQHSFTLDLTSPHLKVNITKGHYDQSKSRAEAFYIVDIKDLAKLETLLGHKYLGAFYAMGELRYDKYVHISGLSKSFGGMSDFTFEKDGLHIKLDDVSLNDIMMLFPIPSMIDADATGDIYYNFIRETMIVNADLKNATFLHSKLVDIIHEKAGVKMMKERFDRSRLEMSYYDSVIHGFLKLQNQNSHLYLTGATVDTKHNTIDAYFDFKMQKQEFRGKVYGSLNNPDVNLDMQKLIKYQMNKQLDTMMGKDANKMIDRMPMGGMAKDVAADLGASFMGIFF